MTSTSPVCCRRAQADAAPRAAGIARRGKAPHALREQVDQHQFVLQLSRQVEQQLQHFHGLHLAEHRGHRAEHAGLDAIADEPVPRRLRPLAAEARSAAIGAHDLQLAFVLVDARKHGRHARAHGGVVHQELGGEIVGAVDDRVGLRRRAAPRARRRSAAPRAAASGRDCRRPGVRRPLPPWAGRCRRWRRAADDAGSRRPRGRGLRS